MEYLIVYSLAVRGPSNKTEALQVYAGVPMADKIGWKYGTASVTVFWTLNEPCKIPGLKARGLGYLYCSLNIVFVS